MLKKKKLEIVRSWYPNAVTTIDAFNGIINYFEDELEIDPSTVMFADSICSDDVNSIQYPVRAEEFLGPFKLGGLSGFPFVGLTGMETFASHIPDDGGVFIYYGPHVGISKNKEIGHINRFGQSHSTACCGATISAIEQLKKNNVIFEKKNMDFQMNTIKKIIHTEKNKILNSDNLIFEATEILYNAIDKRIKKLINKTKFTCHYVVLMGTILINGDSDMGSFISIKRLELIDFSKNKNGDYLKLSIFK
jgi:hypothetical protein